MRRGPGADRKIGYTHFIGVLVPDSLSDTVLRCRAWMSDRYGCSSGYRTAPHITIASPFSAGDPDVASRMETALLDWCRSSKPFEAGVSGFGSFAERTIYVRVNDAPEWVIWYETLARALLSECPGLFPPRKEPFTPHVTVANRDIPRGAVAPSLEHFAGLDLREIFTVDRVALFAWRNGLWNVDAVIPVG